MSDDTGPNSSDKTERLRDIFLDASDGEEEVVDTQEERTLGTSEESQAAGRSKETIPCPNDDCDGSEAYWSLQQTRAADESETRFYECVDCGQKWRDYD